MADGIPNTQAARRDSHAVFRDYINTKGTDPSMGNLYSVVFSPPKTLMYDSNNPLYQKFQGGHANRQMIRQLNMYATAVNLPSKQLTTGQIVTQGAPYKYATGTAYSQININFTMPRSQHSRNFFERWTTMMASDSEQYTRYYEDYVCPQMYVYKWERGGGEAVISDPDMIRALRASGTANQLYAKKYQLTAAWELRNLYPYNIGSVQLDNDKAKLMSLSVGFYYERYRFFAQDKFDDPGLLKSFTAPSASADNNTDPETDRNNTLNQLFSATPLTSGMNFFT